LCLNLCELEV